jgi:sulfide:quinone oxidoreductase
MGESHRKGTIREHRVEFGGGLVGKVDADFLSGPAPTALFLGPSADLAAEKEESAAVRRQRWFGS